MAGLTRWDPFSDLTSMHSQLDDLVNNFFRTSLPTSSAGTMPALDVYTNDDKELVAEVSAPGFGKDDVEVSVNEGVLEIKGEKREKQEEGKQGKRNYMLRESHASFYRRIALPRHADSEQITADFTDGVLKVTVPFKELPKPKRVTIGSGSNTTKKIDQ